MKSRVTEGTKKGHRERLRQRFLSCEEGTRSDEVLLELLLMYAIPRKDVQPLAKNLINRFGRLEGVLSASTDELCSVKGVKEVSAVLIKLVDWISSHHDQKGKPTCSGEGNRDGQLTFLDSIAIPRLETPESKMCLEAKTEKTEEIPESQYIPPPPLEAKLYSITGLNEAVEVLPGIPDTEDIEEVKRFLRDNLHFNSERTRRDYAAYIVKRIFPEGIADKPFRQFSVKYGGTQSFRDVCFYRFARSEPLTIDIVLEVLLPAIGAGKLSREHIRSFLSKRFGSDNRNVPKCVSAVVNALTVTGIAATNRGNLRFAYRDINIPAFAFLIHGEFPQPGMYDIQKLEKNEPIKAMLWNPNQILSSLYELRNMGLINRISEIDSVRQFTTKYTLGELVDHLTDGGDGI